MTPPLLARFAVVLLLAANFGLAAQRPNILFLLSDDHSTPWLGCYNNKDVRSPNLDRFASQGMRFDRMFVTCPQCVPSRASLMTGQSPVAVRMVRFTSPLPSEVPALPDLLRQAGYFTGVGGRHYHLDGPPSKGQHRSPVLSDVMDGHHLRTFTNRVDYVQDNAAGDFGKKLDAFLDKAPADKPWFFWLGFSDPHHPWTTKGPGGVPDPAKLTLPPYLPDLPGVREDLARYIAEVEHMDGDFQRVIERLEARGLHTNTLVVFMGDNGMAFPHGKGALHDPGLNTPLIVRWPGVVKPDSATHELVSGEDFAPTMLEAAGVTAPKCMSGVSYLKLLRGEPFAGRKYIFGERGPHGGDGGMRPEISAATFDLSRCARSARYKLIYNCTPHQPVGPVDSQRDPGWQQMVAANQEGKLAPEFVRAYFTTPRKTFEFYDLDADPGELNNLDGVPTAREAEMELKRALTEKMVLDSDFLPTPLR